MFKSAFGVVSFMLYELVIFLLSIALLAAVYWFFRAFKDSSLSKPLIIIDLGLLAFAVHNIFELLNAFNQTREAPYSLYSNVVQIIAYLLLLAGCAAAWKGFKSFDWLKELGRQ